MLLSSVLAQELVHLFISELFLLLFKLFVHELYLWWHCYIIHFYSSKLTCFYCKPLLIHKLYIVTCNFHKIVSFECLLRFRNTRIRILFHWPRFSIIRCRIRVEVPEILSGVLSYSQISDSGSHPWVLICKSCLIHIFLNVWVIWVTIFTLTPFNFLLNFILKLFCLLFLLLVI